MFSRIRVIILEELQGNGLGSLGSPLFSLCLLSLSKEGPGVRAD